MLKNITILATGGTIAGQAASATQMTGYTAGVFSVQDLLSDVPGLDELAHISGEQVCNIDSSSMTDALLLQLAQRANELLARTDVDGLVITHGTDTLEETAYFLNLVLKSSKPVVVVGAMRPATAVSADGPLNLINAVKVAVQEESVGRGVLVVMNDEIYGARDVSKTNTTNVATFKAPGGAQLGFIIGGIVRYYYAGSRLHTVSTPFAADALTALPRVDIIYTHVGEDGALIEAVVAAGAKGLVYAGSGMGSVHEAAEPALVAAAAKGVAVVRASRTGSGIVAEGLARWTQAGFIPADNLNPQKARILLQLALTVASDRDKIKEMFAQF
jgi:L-asparaginase